MLAGLILAVLISGCGGAHPGAAAAVPPAVPGEVTTGPDLSGVTLPDFVMPIIHGGISLPDRTLTPGAVTTTDANDVCDVQSHSTVPQLPSALQTAVYAAYGDTSPDALHKHTLDWLVPYNRNRFDSVHVVPAGGRPTKVLPAFASAGTSVDGVVLSRDPRSSALR